MRASEQKYLNRRINSKTNSIMKEITKIEYEENIDSVSIYVGPNTYSIPMDRVKNKESLLGWIIHLLIKEMDDQRGDSEIY